MSSTQESPGNFKILVVDDDTFIANILKRIVEKLGCDVKCIHDGNEVGNALIAYEPDVIFLDLILPGIDGVEIIRNLGQAGCKSKIVLMSGLDKRTLASVSLGAKQNSLDVIDAITKPFAPGQVEGILQPLIDLKSSNQSSGVTKQPTLSFGSQIVYEPEATLEEDLGRDNNWIRASLFWRMDDAELVDIASLVGDSYNSKIVKGVLETVLRGIHKNKAIFTSDDQNINVKIPLLIEILNDEAAPNYLDQLVTQTGLSNQSIMFEIDEGIVTKPSETTSTVLSRLKIKGFKISVCVKEKIDEVLALLDKLPIDEVTLNMDYVRFGEGQIKNTETEFEIASFASYVTKIGLVASVKNVSNAEQADFAKRCKFSKASGRFIREPGSARTINEFFNKK